MSQRQILCVKGMDKSYRPTKGATNQRAGGKPVIKIKVSIMQCPWKETEKNRLNKIKKANNRVSNRGRKIAKAVYKEKICIECEQPYLPDNGKQLFCSSCAKDRRLNKYMDSITGNLDHDDFY